MSLWTPYADAPLDLSKVKQERFTPEARVDYYAGYYHQPQIASQGFAPYYPSPYPYGVPSAQMSPVSATSTCSGYDGSAGYYPPVPVPTLSPPESPQQKNYMADAEVLSDDPDFQAFERAALRAMAERNGGSLLGANPRMRRAVQSVNQTADDSYRKQRERNNHAAKQSRDRRKLREIHLALKVAFLRNELAKMKTQLAAAACRRCHRLCDC